MYACMCACMCCVCDRMYKCLSYRVCSHNTTINSTNNGVYAWLCMCDACVVCEHMYVSLSYRDSVLYVCKCTPHLNPLKRWLCYIPCKSDFNKSTRTCAPVPAQHGTASRSLRRGIQAHVCARVCLRMRLMGVQQIYPFLCLSHEQVYTLYPLVACYIYSFDTIIR